ncbi:MAG TPA: hypothetical protein VFQ61_21230 [Polyangiaceae bacterium]|nr:hypothetical protein [Polyangiaceae bacterium]
MATESEEALLAKCHSDWGSYPERVASCFVGTLGECLAAGCEGDDDGCYTDALVAYDPSIVDIDSYEACRSSDDAAGCDDLTRGYLKDCLARTDECNVWDDLCASAVALKQPYRGEAEACLSRSCEELEACLYAAMGRRAP